MRFQETVKAYFRNRRAIAELRTLDEARLSDLGVRRSHIRAAVEGRI